MGSDPKSLKTVELVNWTGQAFIGGREHVNQIRDRKELSEPGVYMCFFLMTQKTADQQKFT